MTRYVDSAARADDIVDAINHLIASEGVDSLGMRAIARASGLAPSSLSYHLGSRDQVLRVGASITGKRRLAVLQRRVHAEGALAFLPLATPLPSGAGAREEPTEDVTSARVWLGWRELGRAHEEVRTVVRTAVAWERGLLDLAQPDVDRDARQVTAALVDGLLVAVCETGDPLSPAAAREALRAHLATSGAGGRGQPAERADSAAARSEATIRSGSSAE